LGEHKAQIHKVYGTHAQTKQQLDKLKKEEKTNDAT